MDIFSLSLCIMLWISCVYPVDTLWIKNEPNQDADTNAVQVAIQNIVHHDPIETGKRLWLKASRVLYTKTKKKRKIKPS